MSPRLQALRRQRARIAAELTGIEGALERRLAGLTRNDPELAAWFRLRYQKPHAERLR